MHKLTSDSKKAKNLSNLSRNTPPCALRSGFPRPGGTRKTYTPSPRHVPIKKYKYLQYVQMAFFITKERIYLGG